MKDHEKSIVLIAVDADDVMQALEFASDIKEKDLPDKDMGSFLNWLESASWHGLEVNEQVQDMIIGYYHSWRERNPIETEADNEQK